MDTFAYEYLEGEGGGIGKEDGESQMTDHYPWYPPHPQSLVINDNWFILRF